MPRLFAAGSNARGQLANGTLLDSHEFRPCHFFGYAPNTLPTYTKQILRLACGANHVLALLECCTDVHATECRIELWGCGDGTKGQLGSLDVPGGSSLEGTSSVFRLLPLSLDVYGFQGYKLKDVAASWETSFVVISSPRNSDVLLSFGANEFGDLGIETAKQDNGASVQAVSLDHLFRSESFSAPISYTIDYLTAGPHHVVANLTVFDQHGTQNVVVGWGTSRHGQLGGSSSHSHQPVRLPQIISVNESMGNVVAASCGNQHTLFLHDSRRVTSLGSNRKLQLQGVDSMGNVSFLDCTWYGSYLAVVYDDQDLDIVATGSCGRGQLGRSFNSALATDTQSLPLAPVQFPFTSDSHRLKSIKCGSEHVLALFAVSSSPTSSTDASLGMTSEVWGWGWNEHGNLGTGRTKDISRPTRIWPPQAKKEDSEDATGTAIDIWAGCGTSWIVVDDAA